MYLHVDDGGLGAETEDEGGSSVETDGQQLLLEVQTGDCQLVIVTSRVPKPHLHQREVNTTLSHQGY